MGIRKPFITASAIGTLLFSCCGVHADQFPTKVDPSKVWEGVIELKEDTLTKYILNDLPGTICVLQPTTNRGVRANLLGGKVLKKNTELPKLIAQPTPLISTEVSGDLAANISYLSFVSFSFGKTNNIRFSATETASAAALDNQIDWLAFSNRVAAIRRANTNLSPNTIFGVVRVASVLTITYQAFRGVNSAGKISGWGFSGDGKYLSQNSDLSNAYKVGVNLTYSDDFIRGTWPPPASINANVDPGVISTRLRQMLESSINVHMAETLEGSAEFIDEAELLQ